MGDGGEYVYKTEEIKIIPNHCFVHLLSNTFENPDKIRQSSRKILIIKTDHRRGKNLNI